MARIVYLHVGTAKSGTTYLQRMLARNRDLLHASGVVYPGTRSSHFLASMDLRQSGFKGYVYPATDGAWDRLVAEVQGYPGTALVSHETFGRTPPSLIRKAVESFPDSEVRVLVTCRDLGRQIPAVWQERVKNRNPEDYSVFLERVFDTWNDGKAGRNKTFWRTQNLIELTRRWALVVGAENVRVVTVPASGADPNELWHRFMRASDLPDLDYELGGGPSNPSLGTAETELLRRLNPYYPDELTWPQYEYRIKNRFVPRDLSRHNTGGRLSVPEEYRAATEQFAGQMIDFLRASGCPVVGDLEELRPSFRPPEPLPDEISTEQLLDLSLQVVVSLSSRRRPVPASVSGREAAGILARKVRQRLHLAR